MTSFKKILRQEDLRYTRQREEIWNEIQSSSEHRDAEEIYISLLKKDCKVSRATVYRTIELLSRNGIVNQLNIGDGRSRYEYNAEFTHHDHLVCTGCGKIIEFHDQQIENRQEIVAEQNNFKLNHHNHQLFGICEECH